MEFRAPGKWILLGEHSVVRGSPALVFPLSSRELQLHCVEQKAAKHLSVKANTTELQDAIFVSLTIAEKFLSIPIQKYFHFHVNSSIPLQAGLGSSAALAVALCHFLVSLGLLEEKNIFPLAWEMENHFHGSSSGIDIAAVSQAKPICFTRGNPPIITPLVLSWKPHFFLFDSGLRSKTSECVKKVIAMNRPDLDEQMSDAVAKGKSALEDPHGFAAMQSAILQARDCFEAWGLFPQEAMAAAKKLEAAGAVAVKPTGSGGGGFLLSLWKNIPPKNLELIPA